MMQETKCVNNLCVVEMTSIDKLRRTQSERSAGSLDFGQLWNV